MLCRPGGAAFNGFLPLQDSSALGVTALSYAGSIFLAFNADTDIVPDLDEFADAMRFAFGELYSAAADAEKPKAKKQGPKKRPPLGTK